MCMFGTHRPLNEHSPRFVDMVSGKMVYRAKCRCGKAWLVDSRNGWMGFKVEVAAPAAGQEGAQDAE